MKKYLVHTELWEVRPDGTRFIKNTINAGSRFSGFNVPKRIADEQHRESGQLWIAKELKQGWDQNGPYRGIYRYEIFHVYQEGDGTLTKVRVN
jgi:hypothetical protein